VRNFTGRVLQRLALSSSRQWNCPVSSAAREGVHDGEETNAWVNSTPSRATRSNVGV
jgi:hypothetical protein